MISFPLPGLDRPWRDRDAFEMRYLLDLVVPWKVLAGDGRAEATAAAVGLSDMTAGLLQVFGPHVTRWIDGSRTGLCARCQQIEGSSPATAVHPDRVTEDGGALPSDYHSRPTALSPLLITSRTQR